MILRRRRERHEDDPLDAGGLGGLDDRAAGPAPSTRAMQSGRGSTGNAEAVETTTPAPAKTVGQRLRLLDVTLVAAHAVRLETRPRRGIRRAAHERPHLLALRDRSRWHTCSPSLTRGAHDDDVTGLVHPPILASAEFGMLHIGIRAVSAGRVRP